MRPFKPFWGWTKNTSSSPTQGFFSPPSLPQNFPLLPIPPPLLPTSPLLPIPPPLLPTSPLLPPSPYFQLTPSPNLSRALELEETWDTRLEEGGEEKVRGELHPKCRHEKRKVSSPSLHFYLFYGFFFFLLLEKKKMPKKKRLKRNGINRKSEARIKSERAKRKLKGKLPPFFAFLFFLWFFFLSFAWEEKDAKEKTFETKRRK